MLSRLLLFSLAICLTCAAGLHGQEVESIQSLSSLVDQMNSLWQTFQEPLVSPERAEKVAEQIVTLRKRAGMLSHSQLAMAFGMRAWREQQSGDYNRATEIFESAIELDPYSRELRSGNASAMAAADPMGFFSYLPRYVDAIFVSFQTHSGRYHLLIDILVWLSVAGLFFFGSWALYCLVVYLPLVHFSLTEMLVALVIIELAGVIALQLFGIPLALGLTIWLTLLLVFSVTWAFQPLSLRIVSIVAVLICALSLAALDTVNTTVQGLTQPSVRAAFAAEKYDSNRSTVAALRTQLKEEEVFEAENMLRDLDRKQRLELFLYGFGLRILGIAEDDGVNVERLFRLMNSDDSLGRRARVNLANIRMEKDDIRGATQAYQSVLRANDLSEAFALYNLSRINFVLGNTGDAQEYMSTLTANFGDELERFDLDTLGERPQLLNAGLTLEEIQFLIESGLSAAQGEPEGTTTVINIYLENLTGRHAIWFFASLAVMLASWFGIRQFGQSSYCRSCGKRYSKHSDLDPSSSEICQSCNSAKALLDTKDADLRRDQERRIKQHAKRFKLISLVLLVIYPPSVAAFYRKTVSLIGILSLWSVSMATLYAMDKLPRLDALPFFSHWTALTVIILIVLLAGLYTWAVLLYINTRKERYGTQR